MTLELNWTAVPEQELSFVNVKFTTGKEETVIVVELVWDWVAPELSLTLTNLYSKLPTTLVGAFNVTLFPIDWEVIISCPPLIL